MLNENSGAFRIRATGMSRGVKRSIVTTLRRTSFLDYLYFTDYEASDPNSFAVDRRTRTRARTYCVQYRAIRNQTDWCRDNVNITFPSWDAIRGPLHTNDDLLTCGSPDFGRQGEEDVIEIHGPAPGGYTRSTGSGCSGAPDFYGPVRQPAEHLPVPTSNTALLQAADPAYVFTGKTEITFNGTSNMVVRTFPGGVATDTTMPLPQNGVIYVKKNGACTLQAPRQIDYNVNGEWRCAIARRPRHLPEVDDARLRGRHPGRRRPGGQREQPGARPDRQPLRARQARRERRLRRQRQRPATTTGSRPRCSRSRTRSWSTTTSAAPRWAR